MQFYDARSDDLFDCHWMMSRYQRSRIINSETYQQSCTFLQIILSFCHQDVLTSALSHSPIPIISTAFIYLTVQEILDHSQPINIERAIMQFLLNRLVADLCDLVTFLYISTENKLKRRDKCGFRKIEAFSAL